MKKLLLLTFISLLPTLLYADNPYNRKEFGHGWGDFDKDCQDARQEILIDHSQIDVAYKTSKKCRVISGLWRSEFTGQFHKTPFKLDIDHIVPLQHAWLTGAKDWSKTKRIQFANDPVNLLPVERSLNRSKGAKSPVRWLPPKNKCRYMIRWFFVKRKYELRIRNEERTVYKKWCKL